MICASAEHQYVQAVVHHADDDGLLRHGTIHSQIES